MADEDALVFHNDQSPDRPDPVVVVVLVICGHFGYWGRDRNAWKSVTPCESLESLFLSGFRSFLPTRRGTQPNRSKQVFDSAVVTTPSGHPSEGQFGRGNPFSCNLARQVWLAYLLKIKHLTLFHFLNFTPNHQLVVCLTKGSWKCFSVKLAEGEKKEGKSTDWIPSKIKLAANCCPYL